MLDIGADRCGPVFDEARERAARRMAGMPLGVETSLFELDRILGGGFQPGQVYILGAPPGTGKSALALLFARHISMRGGRALYAAYEVGPRACRMRALSDIASVKGDDIQLGRIDPSKLETFRPELERQTEGIAFIDATREPRPRADTLAGAVCALNASNDPFGFLLIVDYLQLAARFAGYDDERDIRGKVAMFSNDLAQLARACNIPVLALSSVGRASYKESSSLAAFKETGDIESDADVAMILGPRDETSFDELRGRDEWPLTLRVLKNRHGRTGQVPLTFLRPFLRFTAP